MKTSLWLPLLLLYLPCFPATAQTPDPESIGIEELAQMAALMPSSTEFNDAWRAYVGESIGDMEAADSVIEQIIAGAEDFRRQVRAPGGASGPAMRGYQLREKLRGLAEEVLATEDRAR